MIIRRVAGCLSGLANVSRQGYHMLSLLQSKYENEHIKLNPQLFSLYINKLHNAPFSERFLVVLAVDCFRTSQPQEQFREIVAFALKNLYKFQTRASLVVLLNQIYLYKIGERQTVDKLVRRAFEIEENQDSGSPYYNLKLMILISELMGLQTYPEEVYRRIDYRKFKPLTIAMVLQLFYEGGLQEKYPLTEQLVKMFVACQSFIPFADVHHLSYAIRKVTHPQFKECFYRVRRRIQATLGKNDSRQEGKQEKPIGQQKGKDQGQAKMDKGKIMAATKDGGKGNISQFGEEGNWTSDQQLLAIFRKNIEDKYRLVV